MVSACQEQSGTDIVTQKEGVSILESANSVLYEYHNHDCRTSESCRLTQLERLDTVWTWRSCLEDGSGDLNCYQFTADSKVLEFVKVDNDNDQFTIYCKLQVQCIKNTTNGETIAAQQWIFASRNSAMRLSEVLHPVIISAAREGVVAPSSH